MARDLYYARIPYDYAEAIIWDDVMENSWDSARWSADQSEVMVHWVGATPTSISKILDKIGEVAQSHSVENNYIRKTEEGQDKWADRPLPPKKPKKK